MPAARDLRGGAVGLGAMTDQVEKIIRVEVLPSTELQLVLRSGGKASYQQIYREASGVSWDGEIGAFKGTKQIDWTYAEWFQHIVKACAGVGILMRLDSAVDWVGVSDANRLKICAADAVPIAVRPAPAEGDRELTLQAMYGARRRRAEEYWVKKDYPNAIRLYEEFQDHWTKIEKARVTYARKKVPEKK